MTVAIKHGTASGYKKCKCEVCCAYWREYMKSYREKNRKRLNERDRLRYQTRRDEYAAYAKARHEENPHLRRQNRLWHWYRLTPEAYAAMLDAQGGLCAICRTDTPGGGKDWAVDHDHACCPGNKSCGGCVRGLLCSKCNLGIGIFGDSPDLLDAAVDYLVTLRKL